MIVKKQGVKQWPEFGAFSYDHKAGEWEKLVSDFNGLGLKWAQLAGGLVDGCLGNAAKAKEGRRIMNDHGIQSAGLGCYRNLVSPHPSARLQNLEDIKKYLAIAPELGFPMVATETGTRNPESDWLASPENRSQESWDLFFKALDELLPVAEKHGSLLALEGYVNNVVQTMEDLDRTFKKFDSPNLALVLDPYNYMSKDLLARAPQHLDEFFTRYESRFVLAHLKDVSAEGAEKDTPEFRTGVFPQPLYFEFLKSRRPDLPMIFEHLAPEHIPGHIQNIRKTSL
jgi:sugar phosphate isomerase/epimerase